MSRKPMPRDLPIAIRGGLEEVTTPHAGVAGLIQLGRQSNVLAAAEKYLPAKQSPKGLGQGQLVEAFVVLSALGGECLDDFTNLRRDAGLAALLGYTLPARLRRVRQWLDRFHEEALLTDRPMQGSFIPPESRWLAALRAVVEHSIRTYVSALKPGPQVTLDVDAHLVESAKATALPTYAGFRGYQPLLVSWAEHSPRRADEFRDGNVPASVGLAAVVDAAYEQELLDHWAGRGWRFAVSADMTEALRREILALPWEAWQGWQQETGAWYGSGRRRPMCPAAGMSTGMPAPIAIWPSGCGSPRDGSLGMAATPSTLRW